MRGGTNHAGLGRVRIIGGTLRNSRLEVPQISGLRPTPERVRETLFNWLAPVIAGTRCLDLCAGTGALGIEAISRGAATVCFVERDPHAARGLRENLVRLRIEHAQLSEADAQIFLRQPAGASAPFDLVFLDPPFELALWESLACQLERGGWLSSNAWIYVESPHGAAPMLPVNWQAHRQARAGEVAYALYRR